MWFGMDFGITISITTIITTIITNIITTITTITTIITTSFGAWVLGGSGLGSRVPFLEGKANRNCQLTQRVHVPNN